MLRMTSVRSTTPALTAIAALAFLLASGLRVKVVDPTYEGRPDRMSRQRKVSAGPAALQILSVEHALAAADIFWLGIVQEFGKAIEGQPVDNDSIYGWAQAATDLDPRYLTVYHSVAVNFTVYVKLVDDSDALLRKGREALPNAWRLPFMLGYNAYFLRGDLMSAARYWTEASLLPRRPHFLLSLAARARYQAGDPHGAEKMLAEMIPHMTGPARADAELRLKAFRSEPILAAYDRACEAYVEQNGERPASAQVLFEAKMVEYPPEDLYGKAIELDEDCRARTEFITVREDEVLDRVRDTTAPDYMQVVREKEQ